MHTRLKQSTISTSRTRLRLAAAFCFRLGLDFGRHGQPPQSKPVSELDLHGTQRLRAKTHMQTYETKLSSCRMHVCKSSDDQTCTERGV